MRNELVSFNEVTFCAQYSRKSFLAAMGESLPLGHREDFIRKDDGLLVEYNDFILERGMCFSLSGVENFAHVGLLDIVGGFIKPQTGAINIAGTVSSALAHRRLIEGSKSVVDLLSNNMFFNNCSQLDTKPLVERILIFSELFTVANVKLNQLSLMEKVRLSTAVALLTGSDVILLEDTLFACQKSFLDKVFDRITLQKQAGKSFLIAAPSAEAVKGISDKTITYKLI